MEGKTFGLVMQLVSLFAKDPTTLRQEMPVLPLIPPEQIVEYLNSEDYCYNTLLTDAKKYWELHPYKKITVLDADSPVINPESMFGYLLNLTKEPLGNFEKSLEKQIAETIHETIDETDLSTISQVSRLGQRIWLKIGPWIKVRLIDGALFSYIDQQQYLKAAEFSYMNMSYNGLAIKVHRDLIWMAPDKYMDRSKDQLLKEKEAEDRKKFWLWHSRYTTTERVNHVLHHLTNLLVFYNEQFYKAHENKLYGLCYEYLTVKSTLNSAICELKASHHNHLAQSRSKNWFGASLELGMNYIGEWFWKHGYFRTPRPFDETLGYCERIVQEEYKKLKPYHIPYKIEMTEEEKEFISKQQDKKIEDILPKYINAIASDNFYEAKKNCTWYVTKESNFDWLLEYQDMENYHQELEKIFYYQDLLNTTLTQLYKLADTAFDQGKKDKYYDLIQLQYLALQEIHTLHHHRRELKKSFINCIETKLNLADKGLWERISASINRKAFRYFKDGRFYHTITPYPEQLSNLTDQLLHSAQVLDNIKRVALRSVPQDPYFKALISEPGYVHFAYSPYILTVDKFAQYLKQFDDRDLRYIKILSENVDRNVKWLSNDPVWGDLQPVLAIYINIANQVQFYLKQSMEVYQELNRFEDRMRKVLSKTDENYKKTLSLLQRFGESVNSLTQDIRNHYGEFNQLFGYTIKSTINAHQPLDTSRVLDSAGRKFVRVVTTGHIFHNNKTVMSEERRFQESIERWRMALESAQSKLSKLISALSKTLPVEEEGDEKISGEKGKGISTLMIIDNYMS